MCLGDFGEKRVGASPALGVELVIGGAGGAADVPTVDLGAA